MASAGGELLGFLAVRTDDKTGHFVGAILVTDIEGVPKEFRCTDAIRPTSLQRTLYGKSLEAHVFVELCGRPLLKATTSRPEVVLVKAAALLPVRPQASCPVLHVTVDEPIQLAPTERQQGPWEKLERAESKYTPVWYRPHGDYPDDRDTARDLLRTAFSTADPLEPFDRIDTALAKLAEQDDRYR